MSQPLRSMTNEKPSGYSERPLRGQEAFVYGFKHRAKTHHCLGYATFCVNVSGLESLRKLFCQRVTPITNLPIYVKALALTLARNPEANAILFKRPWGYRIARFEQVEVNVPITRQIDGQEFTFIGTIRRAAEKSLADIQTELSRLQRDPPDSLPGVQRIRWFAQKPLWLARFIHACMARSPNFYVRNVGTCGLTIGGDEGHEQFFPIAPTSVVFGLGSAQAEPVVRNGQIVVARLLHCTLMVDNFVISGLLGGRLLRDFKMLLESGKVITDELPSEARASPTR
jgi:pyruvate/2-oxoglutarate dehydrogenase complex dihydrolipoamide acyltransferase (E2) component